MDSAQDQLSSIPLDILQDISEASKISPGYVTSSYLIQDNVLGAFEITIKSKKLNIAK